MYNTKFHDYYFILEHLKYMDIQLFKHCKETTQNNRSFDFFFTTSNTYTFFTSFTDTLRIDSVK